MGLINRSKVKQFIILGVFAAIEGCLKEKALKWEWLHDLYVPITDYYEYQPPTKTFEYVLSGLLCLATATSSNKEVITEEKVV